MLDFMVRFILASLKLIFKLTLIIGGLFFSALGNAAAAMLDTKETDQPEHDEMASVYRKSFITDEVSAAQALNSGDLTSDELVYYQED